MSEEYCVCISCGEKFIKAGEEVENCLVKGVELEGGAIHVLDEVEELRLVIGSFMDKKLLDAVLFLYKELSKEPRYSEMYSWFLRNSQYGSSCKFSLSALKKFKETRLDILIPLLERALDGCKKLKE